LADTASRVLVFALVAEASPVALLATAAVLTSRRGRTNGSLYMVGFLLGQSIAFVVALLIGSAATTNPDGNEELAAALELAFGVGLLVLAWPQRHPRAEPDPARPSKVKAMLARLHRLRPGTAFSVGLLLGVGGVKRLTITLVAGATVGIAGLTPVEDVLLGVLYVLVAAVLVWVPVGVYLVAGERAAEWLETAQGWLTANERRLTFVSTLLFGFLLTTDALVRLV
jgi:threonine/homoserine/homoserine lactone efflux protein